MSSAIDANPTRQEITRQLERMLASDVFRARPQQAKVFEFIVRAAMAKKEISEKDIRGRFYPTPPYDPESTVVRTTVNFIRTKLVRDYYEHSGEDDPVIIDLPPRPAKAAKPAPGKAYQPVFSYNPRNVADHAYREGMQHLRNLYSVFDWVGASQFFGQAIKASPDFAPAYAAMAEMEVMTPMLLPYADPRHSLAHARALARKALHRNPRSWRAHMVLAAVHTSRREWQPAKDEFTRALRLEPEETRYHPWYAAYLMAIGRKGDALELVARRAEERPEDL